MENHDGPIGTGKGRHQGQRHCVHLPPDPTSAFATKSAKKEMVAGRLDVRCGYDAAPMYSTGQHLLAIRSTMKIPIGVFQARNRA
mmetsp:Transcript_8264/g.20314  ORF Transcript_8264/g.20314 Transcript_8264/m.20314 type:complete len:85 (+) Transcript_8264:1348-1602(+)